MRLATELEAVKGQVQTEIICRFEMSVHLSATVLFVFLGN